MRNTLSSLLSAALLAAVLATPAHAAWPAGPFVPLQMDASPYNGGLPITIPDGAGGLWMTWADYGPGADPAPFVRRVDAAGDFPWAPAIVATRAGDQRPMDIASDGQGGVVIAHQDFVSGNPQQLFVQRVSSAGAMIWGPVGTQVSVTGSSPRLPVVLGDDAGGAIVVWEQSGSILAHHVVSGGQLDVGWPASGIVVHAAGYSAWNPRIVDAGGETFCIAFTRAASQGTASELVVVRMRVDGSYDPTWPAGGVVISPGGIQQHPSLLPDGRGGVLLAWERGQGSSADICAQHVLVTGVVDPLWPAAGRVVCAASGAQTYPMIASDLANGLLAAWTDARGGVEDVYATRVLADGTLSPGWPADGAAVSTATGKQSVMAVASDGRGGIGVLWADGRHSASNNAVYLSSIRSDGMRSAYYPADGVKLADPMPYLAYGGLAADGAGGFLASWQGNPGVPVVHVDRWGLAGAHPEITSVTDVPDDEGGFVNVTFARSWLDTMLTLPLSAYRIWREVPAASALARQAGGMRALAFDDERGSGALAAPGDLRVTTDATGVMHYWEMYTAIPCYGTPSYTVTVGTACDSAYGIRSGTSFMIEGRASDGVRAWVSPPALGGSVDNLVPAAPTQLVGTYADGVVTLRWKHSTSPDLRFYQILRLKNGGFSGQLYELMGYVSDTTWTGTTSVPSWFYVCPFDVHIKQGPCAGVLPEGSLATPETPLAFSLEPPSPNPSRGPLVLAFTLPSAGRVSFTIHDAQGRVVRSLVEGTRPAGSHWIPWDGRTSEGRTAPPGVYFARLTCGDRTVTRRLLRLP